jgi:phage terminase small subunit
MTKPLTPKQKRFCEEYLKDCNATQAYIRAGYKGSVGTAEVESFKLLRNPKVQACIQQSQAARSQRTQIDADRVLKEYARIAFANITDILSFDSGGVTVKDSKDLQPDITAALESLDCSTVESEAGARTSVKIRMHSKISALNMIAKLIGMDKEAAIKATIAMGYEVVDPRTGEAVSFEVEEVEGD